MSESICVFCQVDSSVPTDRGRGDEDNNNMESVGREERDGEERGEEGRDGEEREEEGRDGEERGEEASEEKSDGQEETRRIREAVGQSGLRQKFIELQRRREMLVKRSTDDLRRYDETTRSSRKRRRRKHKAHDSPIPQQQGEPGDRPASEGPEAQWSELKQYFHANKRLEPPPCSRPPSHGTPLGRLDKRVEAAIAEGDIDVADRLSDQVASREFGVMVSKAVECREFVAEQRAMSEAKFKKKKPNLAWGFEAKKRWETKSNMGYM
ncbi:protein FAM204A [Lethenteron reissneri]|uniref:protein FAM204A n=1 Tax=Lethenteron reissneri TaxID=7753 RepID=UPI002AB6D4D5|nr:protein FAM204A [Lethenteron reissneri]